MLRKLFLFICLFPIFTQLQAQGTALKPGDIAIIAFQSDNNDQFAFLSLVDLAPNTQIQFSEKGWNASITPAAFVSTTEGVHTWTAPNTGLPQSTVVVVSFNSLGTVPVANFGTVVSTAAAKLSTSGDEIIAFQGPASAPNFIYAFGSRPWINTGIPTSNQSWLPAALINGITARDFATESDNQYFKYTNFSGTRDSVLAAIGNVQNWTRSNTRFTSLPDWNIQVVSHFYLRASGDPSILSNWFSVSDSSNPISFTKNAALFHISQTGNKLELSANWTVGNLLIEKNNALDLKGFHLMVANLLDSGQGVLIGSDSARLTIKGKSGPLRFDSTHAKLNNLNLDANATTSLITQVQIVPNNHKGFLSLADSAQLITNNLLSLCASEKGESMLQPMGNGAKIIGKIIVQKFIPGSKRNYRFMSHPFANSIALNQLTNSIDITGLGGSVNGFTNTSTNNPSAFWYQATTEDTVMHISGWNAFTNTNGLGTNAWKPYQGIRINIRGSKSEGLDGLPYTPTAVLLQMKDSINSGNQVITLSKGINNAGFNLIGNPFLADIDMSKILLGANVVPNYYLWDPYLGTKGGYTCYPFSNSIILPSFTAFFAQTSDTLTGNQIQFPESCKTSANLAMRVLGANEKPKNQLELLVEADSVVWDHQLFIFKSDATDSIDKFDAKKMLNLEFNLFSLSKENEKLCIDTRSSQHPTIIPIGLVSSLNKKFNLKVASFPNLPDYDLYFIDKMEHATIIMNDNFYYSFQTDSLPQMGQNNRFEIQLKNKNTSPLLPPISPNGLSCFVFPNPTNNFLFLRIATNKKLPIYLSLRNALGQVLLNEKIEAQPFITHSISMKKWAIGTYVLIISNGDETISKKIIYN
ncbi:MAG: T9SS type A sorting domain-containing protein [Bacteroidetes bacterium]|nr:T9SS type A sorting domain-containing protein [Bacteroidota bacterium]